jgi:hypothetical protein
MIGIPFSLEPACRQGRIAIRPYRFFCFQPVGKEMLANRFKALLVAAV